MPISPDQSNVLNNIIRMCEAHQQRTLMAYEEYLNTLNPSTMSIEQRRDYVYFLFHILGASPNIMKKVSLDQATIIRISRVWLPNETRLYINAAKSAYAQISVQAKCCLTSTDEERPKEIDYLQEIIRNTLFHAIADNKHGQAQIHTVLDDLKAFGETRQQIRNNKQHFKERELDDYVFNILLLKAMCKAIGKHTSDTQKKFITLVNTTELSSSAQQEIEEAQKGDRTLVVDSSIMQLSAAIRSAKDVNLKLAETVILPKISLLSDKFTDEKRVELNKLFTRVEALCKKTFDLGFVELFRWTSQTLPTPVNLTSKALFIYRREGMSLVIGLRSILVLMQRIQEDIKVLSKQNATQSTMSATKQQGNLSEENQPSGTCSIAAKGCLEPLLFSAGSTGLQQSNSDEDQELKAQKQLEINLANAEARRKKQEEKLQKINNYQAQSSKVNNVKTNVKRESSSDEEEENDEYDSVLESEPPQSVDISNAMQALSSSNRKLLLEIMCAKKHELHHRYSYKELKALAVGLGATVHNGKSSHHTFRFPRFDIIIESEQHEERNNQTGATGSVASAITISDPHKGQEDLILGVYVNEFRMMLEALDIRKYLYLLDRKSPSPNPSM